MQQSTIKFPTFGRNDPYLGKEENFQAAAAKLLTYKYPMMPFYHVPNGGWRHKAVAAKLKAQGVQAGVPDLVFCVPSGPYHGLYIELKVKGGKLSPHQKFWLEQLATKGYAVAVCYSLDGLIECLEEYLT